MRSKIKTLLFIAVFSLILLSGSCKTKIVTLPIGDEAYPIRQLENGNYEVSKGYVIKHTAMMAEITILKAKLEERGGAD